MGGSETETPAKTPKASPAPEQQAATGAGATPAAVYPDWPGFQAYTPIPPPGFFPPVASRAPQAHSYVWGTQHIMPPYATPPYVMYSPGPGGLYAHPSFPPGSHPYAPYAIVPPNGNVEAAGNAHGGSEADSKPSDGKEKGSLKRTKGSLGSLNMITGKNNNEPNKASGASANGVFSQSGESGSEASSDGTDANSENANTSQNGTAQCDSQNGAAGSPSRPAVNQTTSIIAVPTTGGTGPATNLNIGMDYSGAPWPQMITPICGKVPAAPFGGAATHEIPSDMWAQDERELKRQRRKQSNRESARRSRLRKQAECEELAQRLDGLKEENSNLSTEVARIRKDYKELLAQNSRLKERLGEVPRRKEDAKPN